MGSLGVAEAWDCEAFGPFVDRCGADDYDYWMRALEAGAVFHYERAHSCATAATTRT